MLEKIKSDFIKSKILEYLGNKKILKIFKYNQFYQYKKTIIYLNFTKQLLKVFIILFIS